MNLSETEKTFIKYSLYPNITSNRRLDGRSHDEVRECRIIIDPVPQASGSARVTIDNQLDVLVSIKADIGVPKMLDNKPTGSVFISVEKASNITEDIFYIEQILRNVFASNTYLLSQLSLQSGKICWILYIDCLIFDINGPCLDFISLACLKALQQCKLPNVILELSGRELSIEIDESITNLLDTSMIPLCSVVAIASIDLHSEKKEDISRICFIDPSEKETIVSQAIICVSFNRINQLVGLFLITGTINEAEIESSISLGVKSLNKLFNI